jgi:oligosaccharide reducing-end xylanase
MNARFILLFCTFALMTGALSSAQDAQPAPQPPTTGAFESGQYRNVFAEWGKSETEIREKIDAAWEQLFYGDDASQRVYYPVGDDMAYMLDTGNQDVRSEGMSYGMMIAVQLDKKEEFDRLWTWTKTYMYHADGQYAGYFSWHNRPDGEVIDANPASDGEEWFVMALFFAAARWGNGEGIYNYQAEANAILHTALHTDEGSSSLATNLFDPETKMVVFVPKIGRDSTFTDPSYHLPHYYELWARWAEKDNDFWREAASVSRDFWHTTAHPETGLMPNYAEFTGEPRPAGDYGEFFYSDSWRNAMNVAVDYAWFAADAWQIEQSNRLLEFFHNQGIGTYSDKFPIDGSESLTPYHSEGLVAMNAVAALAATTPKIWDFVEELWNTRIPSGQWRYYNGLLYLMALMHLGGEFRIYDPTASTAES